MLNKIVFACAIICTYINSVQAVPITNVVKNNILATDIIADPIISTSLITVLNNYRKSGNFHVWNIHVLNIHVNKFPRMAHENILTQKFVKLK